MLSSSKGWDGFILGTYNVMLKKNDILLACIFDVHDTPRSILDRRGIG